MAFCQFHTSCIKFLKHQKEEARSFQNPVSEGFLKDWKEPRSRSVDGVSSDGQPFRQHWTSAGFERKGIYFHLDKPCRSRKKGYCQWTPHCKQAVYFFRSVTEPQSRIDNPSAVAYTVGFNPKTGDVVLDFQLIN
ncbi:hypothetical protein JRQ81_006353 [Phrynocephalus forsythii]|uniref:Uncharacterized protein n=1 Tax=Phrynocephalus forsythii TaxID=171643 RepID=A0A9Q0XGI8_9SAUR|nr:hypothetical protein JRQ81_006353 [Phrynocephalus forsythii]